MIDQSSPEARLKTDAAEFAAECWRDRARLTGEQLTAAFNQPSRRRIDSGKAPIEDSPLWGGNRQEELF